MINIKADLEAVLRRSQTASVSLPVLTPDIGWKEEEVDHDRGRDVEKEEERGLIERKKELGWELDE